MSAGLSRRRFLRASAGAGAGALALGTATPAAAGATATDDVETWLSGTDNYDDVADERGNGTVTVTVGASGNGGTFAFEPAAVRVDPGTTVVWEWSGEGGVHNVAAADGRFASDLVGEAGHTFERTFDERGVVTYECRPHTAMGMRGAVVVGDGAVGDGSDGGEGRPGDGGLLAVGGGVALVAGLTGLFVYGIREHRT